MSDNTYAAAFYSTDLLHEARRSCSLLEDPGEPCQVPILLAAMSVEVFLNDLTEEFRLPVSNGVESERLHGMYRLLELAAKEGASTRFRVQLVHLAGSGKPIDAGANPYQDFDLLVRLRNALVHAGPVLQKPDERRTHQKLVRALQSRGLVREGELGTDVWRGAALRPAVARWSCNAALHMVLGLGESLGDLASYSFMSYGFSKIQDLPLGPAS